MTGSHTPGPCPLCGSADIYVAPGEVGSGGQWVPPVHVGCKACTLDLVDLETDTREGSIAKWNRRAVETDLLEALTVIAAEAKVANDVIRLNRDGAGQGRIRVATAMHRLEQVARAAISKALGLLDEGGR